MNRKQKADAFSDQVEDLILAKLKRTSPYGIPHKFCREQFMPDGLSKRDKDAYMGAASRAMIRLVHAGILTRPRDSDTFFAPLEFEPTWWYERTKYNGDLPC